jgi:hypothetical protein
VVSRAISTAVDAVVFLLLVSAAVSVLAVPSERPARLHADDTAALLATSTATVSHTPPGAERGRRASGTYAGLLARAAVADARLDGRRLTPQTGFVRGVRDRTAAVIGPRTQVSARWAPYEGAPLAGQVTVGPDPPPAADLHVETVRVPVHVPVGVGSRDSPEVAADALAGALDDRLLPADPTVLPRPGDRRAALRHRRRALAGGDRSGARAALRRRFVTDFRTDGVPASEAVTAGTATVVVRRWRG